MNFIRSGMKEIYDEILKDNEVNITKSIEKQFTKLDELSTISSAVDIFITYESKYLTISNVYGYYSIYGEPKQKSLFISSNDVLKKEAIYDDDFIIREFKKINAISRIILKTTKDYLNTFPSAKNGLVITFVNPNELQPIVSAIHNLIGYDMNSRTQLKIKLNILFL